MDPTQRAFLRGLTSQSFYHFVKVFGSYCRQGGDISPIIHRQVCDFISDYRIKRKGLGMPRNLRKTTICDRWFPIWRYLHNNNIITMIGSETKELASESIKWIKAQLRNHEFLREVYPELKAIDDRYENKHTFSNEELILPRKTTGSTAPTITCIGVGGAAQGRHVDLLCLTDIIGDKAMTSQTTMLDTILWCDSLEDLLVEPHLNNPNASEITIDFTHWTVGDAYEAMQNKYSSFDWRIVPGLKADDALIRAACRGLRNIVYLQHPAQAVGETNFPDVVDEDTGLQRFSTDYYKKKQVENERIFWTQHMNMPHHTASAVNSFKYEWIRWYSIERDEDEIIIVCEDDKQRIPLSLISLYGAIDPGGFATTGLKKTGSRCAFVIAGQDTRSAKKFVLDTWADRIMRPSDFVSKIITTHKKWRPHCWLVETIGAQEYIFNDMRESAEKQSCILPLRRTPKDSTTLQEDAKNRRIANLITPFSDGCVYLMHSMQSLIAEITSFPGLNNDILDALSWINQIYWTSGPKIKLIDANRERQEAYLQNKSYVH